MYPFPCRIGDILGAIRRNLVIVLIFVANFYFIHLLEVILLRNRLPDLGLSLWWGQLLFLLFIFFIILLLYTILVVLFLVNRSRLWGCLGLFSWLLNGCGLSFALLSSGRSLCFPELAIACREAQFGVLQGCECKSRIETYLQHRRPPPQAPPRPLHLPHHRRQLGLRHQNPRICLMERVVSECASMTMGS
jgi:hypothetical protein